MNLLSDSIKDDLKKVVKEATGLDLEDIHLEHPVDPAHGDYASNVAMALAGELKQLPSQIGEEIIRRFLVSPPSYLEKVQLAPPGFINFYLKDQVFFDELQQVLTREENYGSSNTGEGRTIVIDYSSPNIAKPFGVGHLRSTIIGQAIYNLLAFQGYKVIGDNHLGDWGTQFGKLICAIKNWGSEADIAKDPIKELTKLYVRFHKGAEANPTLEEEGRAWFKRLEDGDEGARRLWQKCVDWSLEEFSRVYDLLGVKIDLALGESFYEPMLKDVIKEAVTRGVAVESQGALIIKFPGDELPPAIIQKSDGATIYMTRDLVTIKYRLREFSPDKIIYETGVDHQLHFKQLFWAAELLGWGIRDDYVHIGHGMMRLATGRMKTRTGDTILLEEVLDEAISRSLSIVKEKNPSLSGGEAETVARAVGVGAVKYNDLSQHYSTDIVFDWDKTLNLRGNSGPYLQYTHARACAILRKSLRERSELPEEFGSISAEERILVRSLARFPEVATEAAGSYSPNLVCNYLFGLAQRFNRFYESAPVLEAETENLRDFRLVLVAAFAQILKSGLNLLGIATLEWM